MRLNLVLELLDVPGQLLDVLKTIGRIGANIVAVIHQRDVKNDMQHREMVRGNLEFATRMQILKARRDYEEGGSEIWQTKSQQDSEK